MNEKQVVVGELESLPNIFSHVTFNVTVAMMIYQLLLCYFPSCTLYVWLKSGVGNEESLRSSAATFKCIENIDNLWHIGINGYTGYFFLFTVSYTCIKSLLHFFLVLSLWQIHIIQRKRKSHFLMKTKWLMGITYPCLSYPPLWTAWIPKSNWHNNILIT